jgi:hypothetical protein
MVSSFASAAEAAGPAGDVITWLLAVRMALWVWLQFEGARTHAVSERMRRRRLVESAAPDPFRS